ncbi:hypothetical protein [Mycolicibacterium fallax]|uniref:Uncharacterized protein n=1 Tax=Mycolicibacterium fallax TaxID=1793 RepID=A0A1X1RJK3_MYCFA|nr:hypothetical protein [Mycolicibacterium fallax]ORV07735.1 hypothetical protein AWC04_03345 [Mycolicibacterium fallax]BBY99196.1 hypothetical protein MFAL_26630 [Mycolicibacterium fallax]
MTFALATFRLTTIFGAGALACALTLSPLAAADPDGQTDTVASGKGVPVAATMAGDGPIAGVPVAPGPPVPLAPPVPVVPLAPPVPPVPLAPPVPVVPAPVAAPVPVAAPIVAPVAAPVAGGKGVPTSTVNTGGPTPGVAALPGPANSALPGQGNSALPGQGNSALPGQGNSALPGPEVPTLVVR